MKESRRIGSFSVDGVRGAKDSVPMTTANHMLPNMRRALLALVTAIR